MTGQVAYAMRQGGLSWTQIARMLGKKPDATRMSARNWADRVGKPRPTPGQREGSEEGDLILVVQEKVIVDVLWLPKEGQPALLAELKNTHRGASLVPLDPCELIRE